MYQKYINNNKKIFLKYFLKIIFIIFLKISFNLNQLLSIIIICGGMW